MLYYGGKFVLSITEISNYMPNKIFVTSKLHLIMNWKPLLSVTIYLAGQITHLQIFEFNFFNLTFKSPLEYEIEP